MNKNFKIALSILFGGLAVTLAVYFGIKIYAQNNPIVICGDDKYSTACLTQYAIDLKLDKKSFIECVQSNKYGSVISTDNEESLALGLTFAPTLFIGEFTDNTHFVGFYVSVASYNDLQTVADNLIENGISKAQKDNLAVVVKRTNDSVKSYLEGRGYTGAEYAEQLAAIQPDITRYLDSFKLFNLEMQRSLVRGKIDSRYGFLYFADYASEVVGQFNSILLQPILADYINNDKMMIAVKDLPISNALANSESLANAARCAGAQNKYFEYTDILHAL